ncbi:MAG TPA: tetratricopeptide repeat protein [Vicinamibacteria bacterium]|nr:tetratricopeptide repeat protein [Vicinamibacteria bacterium]
MVSRRALLALTLVFLGGPAAARAQAKAPAPEAAPASFEDLARRAEEARQAGRLDEAESLYERGLALRPRWAEGLWALGTIAYDRDLAAECRDAFRRLCDVEPAMAPAWGLRGLCEFRLRAFEPAHEHVEKALSLGMPPSETLGRVVLYHHALLLVREAKFDLAIAPLTSILQFQAATREVETACGLVILRRPTLPGEIPAPDRAFVQEAGGAYCALLGRHTDDAVRRFEALVAKRPRERHLHYALGLALAQRGSADSLDQYRREVELFPDEVLARVELGFGLVARGREVEAIAPAEEAVRLAPGLFATHLVLGRALAATGRLDRGIPELEAAAAMQPQIPAIHLALARAYAQAERKADADRENATFRALDSARRGPSSGSPPPPEAP